MLTEIKEIDLIQVVSATSVQVREKTTILRDGQEIAASFHRWSIAKGEDYSAHPERVRAICDAAFA